MGIFCPGLSPRRGKLIRIYLAGPLFSDAEREWAERFKAKIQAVARHCGQEVTVDWPWEFFQDQELPSCGDQAAAKIFADCLSHLDQADLVIALLDGTQVDDGTAFELGYFYHAHRDPSRIIGIRTDFRAAGDCPNTQANAMIQAACGKIVLSVPGLLELLGTRFLELEKQHLIGR